MNQRLVLAVAAVLVTVSAAVAGAGPLETRQMRLQHEIRRGIATGQISQAEATRLRARQQQIRFQIAEARRDGRMTPQERQQIQRELMRQEMRIERMEHNAHRS